MKNTLATSATNSEQPGISLARSDPARVGWSWDWQHWAPYAAVAWSLVYAALGLYWAVSGRGFPYNPELISNAITPMAGKMGPTMAWTVVIAVGLPAVAVGLAMLRGIRRLRLTLIVAGYLLAAVLLLLMTDLNLLTTLAYIPYVIIRFLTGAGIDRYLQLLAQSQWIIAHQLLCLIGGFVWLAATVSYARSSGEACLYCGRRDGPESWNSPGQAARWSRIAVYIGMVPPILYAATRYAWALGIPLGMSQESLRQGQEQGLWISGLSLATFGLVGAALMFGLVQRWGEEFPRWMIGLSGRRVPMALAVVPASIVSVLLIVGGIGIGSVYDQMAENAAAIGQDVRIVVGPAVLFSVWGAALAVATLGYYYRRRGLCGKCGRGAPDGAGQPLVSST